MTGIVLLSNIESTQNEIISCILNQLVEFIPECVIIDFYKNDKLNGVLLGEPIIIKTEQWKYDNWYDVEKHYRLITKEFDNFILVKTPILRGNANKLDYENVKNIIDNVEKDKLYNMQYDLMKRVIERILFVKSITNKNVIQLSMDPEELDFSLLWEFKSYKRYQPCIWGGYEYAPIYEYTMNKLFIQDIKKYNDLYYVGSVLTDDRKYLYDIKNVVNEKLGKRRVGYVRNNPTKGLFDVYDFDNRDKRVGQSAYYYNLMLSKYTFINMPYIKETFNMVRFMEAVICNCVPLIHKGSNLNDILLTFPDIYDIIKDRNLEVKPEDIHIRLSKYSEDHPNGSVRKIKYGTYGRPDNTICNQIKKSDDFKMITDGDYVKGFYKEILGG